MLSNVFDQFCLPLVEKGSYNPKVLMNQAFSRYNYIYISRIGVVIGLFGKCMSDVSLR